MAEVKGCFYQPRNPKTPGNHLQFRDSLWQALARAPGRNQPCHTSISDVWPPELGQR